MLNPHCLLCLIFQSLHNWSLVQNVFIYDIAAECCTCLSLSLNHKDSRTLLKQKNISSCHTKFAVPVVPDSTRSILGKLFRFPVLNVADIPLEKSRTQELNLKQTFPPEGWLCLLSRAFQTHPMLCFLRKRSILSKLNASVGNSVLDFPVTNSFCFVSTTGALVVVLVYWGITSATTTSEGVSVLQFALVFIQI